MIEIPQAAIDAASTVHGGQITDSAIEKMIRLAVRSMAGLDPDVPADEDHDVIVVAAASTAAQIAESQRLADRWTELRERAEKGRDTTTAMYLAARDDEAECRRLAGKLDGIKLVLSYMGDAERVGR